MDVPKILSAIATMLLALVAVGDLILKVRREKRRNRTKRQH